MTQFPVRPSEPPRPRAVKSRILHVVTHLDLGGGEQVALSIIEQLHQVYDFTVFAVYGVRDTEVGRDMKRRLDQLGVPVVSGTRIDIKRGGMLQASFRLARLIQWLRPDVVHLHTDIPEGVHAFSTLFPRPRWVQTMRTVHNTSMWPKWRWVGKFVEERSGQMWAPACSAASLEALQVMREDYGLPRIDDAHCGVILNGVAVPPPAAPADLHDPKRPVRLLFAGRMEPQKGVDLLPAIVERASQLTYRAVELDVHGSGSLWPQLLDWVKGRAPTTPWNVRIGPPMAGLSSRLGHYDAVLMPSRFEGLALTAIETLISGVPLVPSRINGLQELLPDDYPLFARSEDIEDYAQALARLVEAPERYRRVAQAIQPEIAAKYGVERMAREYARVYDLVCREAAQPGGRFERIIGA
ncbi:glycosyltransferase family 4 protein [Deinococcus sonorensis]|uniref:Glycosyltransferase family 4 protein n=2 Tax=Deinococcus sonorensis TaxID=309891 RepID=A0AAU7UCR6_9DEIO